MINLPFPILAIVLIVHTIIIYFALNHKINSSIGELLERKKRKYYHLSTKLEEASRLTDEYNKRYDRLTSILNLLKGDKNENNKK